MDAVFTDLVAGGGHDAAAGDTAHNEGLPDQAGVIALFDGCVERIHIDVENSEGHEKAFL
jgi:hypothetical protein